LKEEDVVQAGCQKPDVMRALYRRLLGNLDPHCQVLARRKSWYADAAGFHIEQES
jgi:hypothetical protein